jgi:hypothetical protein
MFSSAKLAKLLAVVPFVVLSACGGDNPLGSAAVRGITISPGNLTVVPKQTVQFRALGQTGSSDSVPVAVVWGASGGNIDDKGVYTAGNLGSYDIYAADHDGHRAVARVLVGSVGPLTGTVATVQVDPASATIQPNATQQLKANVLDGSGNAVTGRMITWSTSNTAVADVDATGLVHANGAGSAVITATVEGKAGSAAITVGGATAAAAECANPRPEWIWCDDFEQDRLSSYFEYDNAGGNFVRSTGDGVAGSVGMKGHWNIGVSNAGALHMSFGKVPNTNFRPVDGGTTQYREVYWRMYVKNQAGWVGGGGDKMSRAFVFATGGWAQAAIGHVWSGNSPGPSQNYLMVDPASGTDGINTVLTSGYNDFAHLRWLGSATGNTPIFDSDHVGQWYCVEAHMKLNSAGASDGVLEMWVNGVLQAQRTGLNYVGSFSQYGINAIYFENYWNAGSTAAQDRFFDNIVVSKAPIGCS